MPSNKKLIKRILSVLDENDDKRKRRRRRRHKSKARSRSPRRQSSPTTSSSGNKTPSPNRESNLETIENSNTDTTEMEPINPYKEALGMDYEEALPYNGQIHKDIKLNHILTKGLTKEERDIITKKHTVPDNCTLLDAPLLNPEVKAVLTESSKLRDHGIEMAQKQLGLATSIMTKCMTDLIKSEELNKTKLLTDLADATKILANTHYHQTQTRIKLISPLQDKSFNQILSKTTRDSSLYGENLPELLKNLKQMQQVAAQIKKPNPAQSNIRPNANIQRPRQENLNGPPQKMKMNARSRPRKTTQPTNQQHPRWKQHPERATHQQGRYRYAPAKR